MTSSPLFLSEITPYYLDKKLLISLDERWKNHFISKNQNFKVIIDSDQRIKLLGPKVRTGPTTDNPAVSEVSNNE